MAGYIFTLDSEDSLKFSFENGVYSTKLRPCKKGYWGRAQEGTFADYITMREGDYVFFFIKRLIYGVGKLISITNENKSIKDCKFNNYKNASTPENKNKNEYLININDDFNHRWICTFEASPFFFKGGVDMDDLLSFYPEKMNILRTLWKLSFIKVQTEEALAIRDLIYRRNLDCFLNEDYKKENTYPSNLKKIHLNISKKLNNDHFIDSNQFILTSVDTKKNKLTHEMALEIAVLNFMNSDNNIFGKLDYLSHQVVASPFKPIDYMDKMDIFGYKTIEGYDTISNYLVAELKKGKVSINDLEQLMKYVDWVNSKYCNGDYGMIEAYFIGNDFETALVEEVMKNKKIITRNYLYSKRPAKTSSWNNIKLIKYQWNQELNIIEFNEI